MKPFILIGIALLASIILNFRSVAAADQPDSLCEVHYPSDDRIEWECVQLKQNDSPYRLFGKYWRDGLRFNRMDRRHFIAGMWIKVPKRLEELKGFTAMPENYPDAAQEAKFILVDQSEMFLGAYEYGTLVFSTPVAVGVDGHRVPNGSFRIDAADRRHESSLYPVEGTDRPYPMHYGLRFYVEKKTDSWISYWLHGRDVPGHPASHGCIGLYDEEMQKEYYHEPQKPILKDAKKLYEWVVASHRNPWKLRHINYGPKVLIIGTPPL